MLGERSLQQWQGRAKPLPWICIQCQDCFCCVLGAALSSGCCGKPVLSAGRHPSGNGKHPTSQCGTHTVVWNPYPIPTVTLGLSPPSVRDGKLSPEAATLMLNSCPTLIFPSGNLRVPYQDHTYRSNLDLTGSKTPVLSYC